MPFRLPTLDEKACDSELTDLIETTKQEANPPIRTLHNIIGNFFKPSAVLAALGGTHSIQNFVNGSSTPHQWAPSAPSKVNQDFNVLRAAVAQDIATQPTLHPYLVERWFPKTVPKLDSDDFWHKAIHMQTPPVFTSPVTAQPPLPSASPPALPFPLSVQVQPISNKLTHYMISSFPLPFTLTISTAFSPLACPPLMRSLSHTFSRHRISKNSVFLKHTSMAGSYISPPLLLLSSSKKPPRLKCLLSGLSPPSSSYMFLVFLPPVIPLITPF